MATLGTAVFGMSSFSGLDVDPSELKHACNNTDLSSCISIGGAKRLLLSNQP